MNFADLAPVFFFLPRQPRLVELEALDPERDWRQFVVGERAWILQTFLRLRQAGYPVRLTSEVPRQGLVVFYANHGDLLVRSRWGGASLCPVGVRGDHRRVTAGDFEVVQNLARADGERHFYVPLWSQPGLLPRPAERGARLERVAYKGFPANLHSDLARGEWREALAARGIEWSTDMVGYDGAATATERLDWNDFRSVDLYVAIRPPRPDLYRNKPAGKLFNAWRAGVPAVLGPEIAYRELRQSELDYFEAGTAAEALAAIDRLRADPALYLAMVEHGRQRAAEFAEDVIVERWADLLWRVLPQRSGQRPLARLPVWARALVRRVQYQLGIIRG